MKIIHTSVEEMAMRRLLIGFEGENQRATVRIDCASVFAEYPNATPALIVKPMFASAFPVVVERNGDYVDWLITSAVLSFSCDGEIQLVFYEGDAICKSCVGKIIVRRSLKVSGSTPGPVAQWVDDANRKLAEVDAAIASIPDPGDGTPAGGLRGQVLAKSSDADHDVEWMNVAPVIKNYTRDNVATIIDGADGYPVDNLDILITPVQEGEDDPSPDNIRPIRGWNAVTVTRAGKNLFFRRYDNAALDESGRIVDSEDSYCMVGEVKAGTEYYINKNSAPIAYHTTIPEKNGDPAYNGYSSDSAKTFTPAIDGYAVVEYPSWISDPTMGTSQSRNIDTDATPGDYSYQSYEGETYTITFPETVYGGLLNVTDGILYVTHAAIESYNGEPLPTTEWKSDRDINTYVEGEGPSIGAQVVYHLETPISYRLTPTQITTLLGVNNVWANAGSVNNMVYCADTKLYIDKKIKEAVKKLDPTPTPV